MKCGVNVQSFYLSQRPPDKKYCDVAIFSSSIDYPLHTLYSSPFIHSYKFPFFMDFVLATGIHLPITENICMLWYPRTKDSVFYNKNTS